MGITDLATVMDIDLAYHLGVCPDDPRNIKWLIPFRDE